MAKKYRIRVEEIETDVPFRNREYKNVGKDEEGEDKYEYIYFDDTKKVETDVYDQIVDDLDMAALVSVVNNLTK